MFPPDGWPPSFRLPLLRDAIGWLVDKILHRHDESRYR